MERRWRALDAITQLFWLLVLAVIVLFAFFLVLGTFSIGEVGWVGAAVGALAVLYGVHAFLQSRHAGERSRDRSLVRQRERRGF